MNEIESSNAAQMKIAIVCIQRGDSKFNEAKPITAPSGGYEMEDMY